MRIYAPLESREVSSGYVLRFLIRSCSLSLSSASASYRSGLGCRTPIIFFPFSRNTVSHCWDSYSSVLLRSRRLNISSLKRDANLLALSHSDYTSQIPLRRVLLLWYSV